MSGDAEGGVTQILHRTCPLREMSQLLGPQISRRAKSWDARTREVTPGQICGVAETCIKRSLYVKTRNSNNCLDLFTVSIFWATCHVLKYFLILGPVPPYGRRT